MGFPVGARGQASTLDGPPPSPAAVGNNPGTSPQEGAGGASLDSMGGALQIGSDQLPQEILQGVMAVGKDVTEKLDSLAQITPDLGSDWQAIKQLLLATLAKLLVKGAPPSSPTDPGAAFPGVTGGMDRGARPIS